MKSILKIFSIGLIIFSSTQAKADAESAAVGTAVFIGTAFAITGLVDEALSPNELQSFTDVRSHTTSKLNNVNGLLIETKIYDYVPGIFMAVFLKNTSGQTVYIDTSKAKLVFQNGLVRYPDQNLLNRIVLVDGQVSAFMVKAPLKSEFNNQGYFNFVLPIETKNNVQDFSVTYDKNPKTPEAIKFDGTVFNFGFEYGQSFYTGKQGDQAEDKSTGAFGLYFDIFWREKHGVILGIKSIDYSPNANTKSFYNMQGSLEVERLSNTFVGYTYRQSLTDQQALQGSIMYASTFLKYETSSTNHDHISESGLGLRLEYSYRFQKIERGPYQGSYFWYLGADHFSLPDFKNSAGDLKGGNGSIFLGFKIGF